MTRIVGVRAISITAALLSVFPAFCQKGGAAGTGTTTGSTGGSTTTGTGTPSTGTPTVGRIPTTTPSTTTPTTPQTVQQPIFLSGRVMLEDGSAPSEPAIIQTLCNGVAHSEGYTDAKGYFSLELGANRGVIQDASEYGSGSSSMGVLTGSGSPLSSNAGMDPGRKYMGCDLQAKLNGFRSQTVPLSGRRPMDDPNVGVILLHRQGAQEEGKTVSMVSLAAPKEAKKAYDKGMDALKKKKYSDAQSNFEKAVEVYPSYAVAWYELGRLRVAQDQYDIARGSFDEAIKADPKFVLPYVSLSLLELQAKHWQQLADVTEKTVKLDPFDYPQAYFFNSVAHFNMRDLEAAEKSGLEAERLDTRNQFPQVHHLLGMILADRKDWDGAAKRFKTYLKLSPQSEDAKLVRTQLAQVEKIQQQLATAKDQ